MQECCNADPANLTELGRGTYNTVYDCGTSGYALRVSKESTETPNLGEFNKYQKSLLEEVKSIRTLRRAVLSLPVLDLSECPPHVFL